MSSNPGCRNCATKTSLDLIISTQSVELSTASQVESWEEHAYTLGVRAYVYAYPFIHVSVLRYDWAKRRKFPPTTSTTSTARPAVRRIKTPSSPEVGLTYVKGPVILSHPDMGEFYFTFEIGDFHSDNFSCVGKRSAGGKGGTFAVLPPGWKGMLPADIKRSFESPTTFVLVFGRTLIIGDADKAEVNQLQEQYHMTPLAFWSQGNAKIAEKRDVFEPYDRTKDPLADWRTINRAWLENPLPKDQEANLVRVFSEIGIGPGFTAESIDKLPEPTKRGLARAAAVARPMIEEMMLTAASAFQPKEETECAVIPRGV